MTVSYDASKRLARLKKTTGDVMPTTRGDIVPQTSGKQFINKKKAVAAADTKAIMDRKAQTAATKKDTGL